MKQITALTGLLAIQEALGFAPSRIAFRNRRESKSDLQMANEKIGIFFGTSTGGTETVASVIASEFGNGVAAGPFEIDTLKGNLQEKFNEYDCLLVGTPTWNTGADTERSGTGWDEMYYGEMQNLKIQGKKVAVFGLGDSESYCDNYADASGELHDVFESLGCNMHGYTSQDGYEHEESKAIRGEKFCGLPLDVVNQDDLTEERVKNWVSQLKQEGFLETDSSQTSANSNLEVSANSSPEASDGLSDEKVGVFFGTSTGGTETVATAIASELGKDGASGPFEIDSLKGNVQQKFDEYDCLVVGTPTWNTGADTERSGTGRF
jgi:flavodoxin I